MIRWSEVTEELLKILDGARKIGRISFGQEELKSFLSTIDEINALDRDRTLLPNGYECADYKVGKTFARFLYPKFVSWKVESRIYPDVQKKLSSMKTAKILSPSEFERVENKIYGSQKTNDWDQGINGLERPSGVNLNLDVLMQAERGGYVALTAEPFLPYELSFDPVTVGIPAEFYSRKKEDLINEFLDSTLLHLE